MGAVMRLSRVYETAPVGGPGDQGAYLNMVAAVATDLDPFAMLRRLQRIEAEAYRQRIVHWGPRTLDLDLLFYDDFTITSPDLTIPHPRYAERRFVLAPLSDVSPERCPVGWNETLPPDAVTVIGPAKAAAGVPEINPVIVLTVSPPGSPVALNPVGNPDAVI